jgi:hypothetical protein
VLKQGASESTPLRNCLVPQSEAEHAVPAQIGDYGDFFNSYDHMINMGRIFQPDNAVLPQFTSLPNAWRSRLVVRRRRKSSPILFAIPSGLKVDFDFRPVSTIRINY